MAEEAEAAGEARPADEQGMRGAAVPLMRPGKVQKPREVHEGGAVVAHSLQQPTMC